MSSGDFANERCYDSMFLVPAHAASPFWKAATVAEMLFGYF